MKERIFTLLTQKFPNSLTSQTIGIILDLSLTEKQAINSVLEPLNSLIREKKVVFEFTKPEGATQKDIYYTIKN